MEVLRAFMLYAPLPLVRDSVPRCSPSILCAPLISSAILSHSPLLSSADCPEAPPCLGEHDWCVRECVCRSAHTSGRRLRDCCDLVDILFEFSRVTALNYSKQMRSSDVLRALLQ